MARKQRPFQTARVRKMKPIRAKVPPPEPESRIIDSVFFDVEQQSTPSASVEIAAFSRRKSQTTWRVDLQAKAPVETRFSLAPRAEERIVTRAIRNRARKVRELEPVRPAWIDQRLPPKRCPGWRGDASFIAARRSIDSSNLFPPDGRRVYNDPTYPGDALDALPVTVLPRFRRPDRATSRAHGESRDRTGPNPGCTFRAHQFDRVEPGFELRDQYLALRETLRRRLGERRRGHGCRHRAEFKARRPAGIPRRQGIPTMIGTADCSGRASAMPRTWEEPTVLFSRTTSFWKKRTAAT